MLAVANAWYCAALSHELSRAQPLGRHILGQPVVLFRDADGAARALSAVCPHRGADLARGTVDHGELVCPMHGWRFDRAGVCVRVPSQPAALKISPHACTPAFALCESQGIVWIWMGAERPVLQPPHHELWDEGRGKRRMFDKPRLWRCSFVNAVENAIDIAHSPFVHRATLGADQPLLVPRQEIAIDPDQRGFTGTDDPGSSWQSERPGGIPGGLAGLLARMLGVSDIARQYYRYELGGSVFFYFEYASGTFDVLFGHATPSDDEHTWFFGGTTRSRALHVVGDLVQRMFMKGLSDEDEAEVTAMWSNEAALLPQLASAPADEGTLAFRKIWQRAITVETAKIDAAPARTTSEAPMPRIRS